MHDEHIWDGETLVLRTKQFARGESAWRHVSIVPLPRLGPEIVAHDPKPGEDWALVRRMDMRELRERAAIEARGVRDLAMLDRKIF